jgi:hypothetical protein
MRKITILSFFIFAITLQGQNKLLSSIDEFFDGLNWQYSSGANYEYDSNNNLVSETQLFWNSGTSKWENNNKTTYTYNASNKVTHVLYQSWNSITNQFENSYQTINTYVMGLITESLDQTWENEVWKNENMNIFAYNSGLISGALTLDYDEVEGWVLIDKSTPTYNINNRFEIILIDDWDGSNWITGDRILFTYDENNRVKVNTYENWNGANWVEEEKTEYTIDSNGNREKEVNTYDGDTYEENYMYDKSLLMSSFAHPFKEKTGLDYIVEDNPYHNKLLSMTSNNNYRTTYNYISSIVLGVEDFNILDSGIKLYPNPTAGNITIANLKANIKSIDIYNTLGSRVFSTQNTNFNIDFLKSGVYFLNMTINDGVVYTRKIVKK